MKKKIAINGFGRIGRLTFRHLIHNPSVEVVAINDLAEITTLAHLLKYDSAHGQFGGTIEHVSEGHISVNGHKIQCTSERDPLRLNWAELGIDLVLECTGVFRTKEKASMHLKAGAKDVLLSAPGSSDGIQTIVLGVNDDELDRRHNVFSNASCTTNCLAPLVKILEDNYGIVSGTMTTIHAYTADQRIQDAPHRDLRRARAAAYNIVPTSTGAAKATSKVIPSSKGKLFAKAIRVPVITGSLVELTVNLDKPPTVEACNTLFESYAEGSMKGILQYATDPLVSSDIMGNPHSSIFDSLMTEVNHGMLKIVSWYDNEAGYSARLADMANLIVNG